jgi:pimeloyl-ACP methyl ester carboxylesterase
MTKGVNMDIEHHTLEMDGLHWHVVTSGPVQAPPVLLLHCWSGNWKLWEKTMQCLDGKFRFIALDHLGFGQSAKPRGDHYGIMEQARRSQTIMEKLGYARFGVMGHSMGGHIALTLSATFPKMVSRLIVVDPAVDGTRLHLASYMLAPFMGAARRRLEFPWRWAEAMVKAWPALGLQFFRVYFPDPFRQREAALYWAGQISADGQLNASAWAHKAISVWDVTPLLKNIIAPTLAIWGAKDWCVPLAQCDLLEREIPDCRSVRIPEVGHFPMIEAFDTYIVAVESFLKG